LYDNLASRVLNVIAGVMSDFVFDIIKEAVIMGTAF
jgi:hypothetical protein